MEPIEAVKLAVSDKDASFAELREAAKLLRRDTSEGLRLKKKARKKLSKMQENLGQMDLSESEAAFFVAREFTSPEERNTEEFKKLVNVLEKHIAELKTAEKTKAEKEKGKEKNADLQNKSKTADNLIVSDMPQEEVRSKKENDQKDKAFPNQEQYEHPIATNDAVSKEQVNANFETISKFDAKINPLSEDDKYFEESRNGLDMMNVVDDNGNSVDMKPEIVENAKLKTMSDLLSTEKDITEDDYRSQLKNNIDLSAFTILNVDRANELAQNNGKGMRQSFSKMIDDYTAGGKKNKVNVSLDSAISVITDSNQQIDKFTGKIEKQFGDIPAVKNIRSRLNRLDNRMSGKYGKKYEVTRDVVKGTAGFITDLGLVALAGAAGPVGLGIYSLYTFKRHVVPFLDRYQKAKEATGISFKNYSKENKNEAARAGLYTVSSAATMGIAGFVGAYNATTHAGATFADAVTKYAGGAKIAAGLGAVTLKQGSDVKAAIDRNENVGKAVGKMALAIGTFVLLANARDSYDLIIHGSNENAGVINNNYNIYIDNCCNENPDCDCNDKPEPVKPRPVITKPEPVVIPEPEPVVVPEPEPEPQPEPVPDFGPLEPAGIPVPAMEMPTHLDPIPVNVPEHEVLDNGVRHYDGDITDQLVADANNGRVLRDGLFYDQPASNSADLDERALALKDHAAGVATCDTPEPVYTPKDGVRHFDNIYQQILADRAAAKNMG